MPLAVALLVLIALALPLVVAILRSNELFCLDWRDGRLHVRRGRAPQRLLDDLSDVLGHARSRRAVLRAVTLDRLPRLEVKGELSSEEIQQLRNVFGTYPAQKLRSGRARR